MDPLVPFVARNKLVQANQSPKIGKDTPVKRRWNNRWAEVVEERRLMRLHLIEAGRVQSKRVLAPAIDLPRNGFPKH
jgi:hypothetical protein